jgi:hypothetical protein
MRDQTLEEMESRITAKMDLLNRNPAAGALSAGTEFGNFANVLFSGISTITQPAFASLGNAVVARVAAAAYTPEVAPILTAAPLDIMQQLQGKLMTKWTTDDVQQWLDVKNLPELRAEAFKQSLDGRGLLLMKETLGALDIDTYVSEVWPTAKKFHKDLFKRALKELE